MAKVLIIFGTRPEAIKMAPLIKEMQKYPQNYATKVCVTAQHREMLDQVLHLFNITPDYDLNIMKENQDLYDITSNILCGIRNVLTEFRPDLVLVHGDTSTAFTASLASFYQKISVGHVEAGLRTNNIYSPWPEEVNRQLVSRIARFHFAPTISAKENLLKENISENSIVVTGNTVIDTLKIIDEQITQDKKLKDTANQKITEMGYNISNRRYILVTGHRRENFGEGFLNICKALKQIAELYPEIDIVYPVHLNPNVRTPVKHFLYGIKNVYIIEPLEYLTFVHLMKNCYLILTDSGGIQEEAPSFGKPVLVMRNTTERPEAVNAGTVKLVGAESEKIFLETRKLLDNCEEYNCMSSAHNPYGDGKACQRIVQFLDKNFLNQD